MNVCWSRVLWAAHAFTACIAAAQPTLADNSAQRKAGMLANHSMASHRLAKDHERRFDRSAECINGIRKAIYRIVSNV